MSGPLALPDLEAWAIFAHVAESRSFTGAASAAGVSKATVSKAIARLERSLGVQLLHRTSRQLSLTEAGAGLSGNARAILTAGLQAEGGARRCKAGLQGAIRMSVPPGFGPRVIVPVIADFLLVHPAVEIDIRLADGMPDMTTSRLDLAVLIGGSPRTTLLRYALADLRQVLVAAPELLARLPTPAHPADLEHLPCVIDAREGFGWRFRKGARACNIRPRRALAAHDPETLLSAARNGIGFARLPDYLVRTDCRAGDLVEVLQDWSGDGIEVCLVTMDAGLRPERVAAVVEHIRARIGTPAGGARAPAERDT